MRPWLIFPSAGLLAGLLLCTLHWFSSQGSQRAAHDTAMREAQERTAKLQQATTDARDGMKTLQSQLLQEQKKHQGTAELAQQRRSKAEAQARQRAVALEAEQQATAQRLLRSLRSQVLLRTASEP
jgi:ABC-type multidrug transport system fused ATPase/permease subunit